MKRATRVRETGGALSTIDAAPRRKPRQARSRDTVATILKAAARVFASAGYAEATTNRIAERAGVSIGSLYEYFPNKDAILVALMEAHLDEGQQVLRQAALDLLQAPTDLEGTVRRFVTAMVEQHAADPKLHRVLFEEAPRSRRVRRKIQALEDESTASAAHYLKTQTELPIRDPELAASMLVQTIDAMTHKVVIHGDPATPIATYIEEIVSLIMGYLASRQPRSTPA